MYKGSYEPRKPASRRRRRFRRNMPSILLIAVVILLGAVVGSTIAYLVTDTDPIKNSFVPATITTEITENFDKEVKNNVQVKNTGDVDAYIRAAVVVTWQNDDGQVYPTAPVEGTDYTVTWTKDGWVVHTDGYYYYTSVVKPNESTGILLTGCKPVEGKAPDGYHLVVEILSSAIQSKPESAVKEAWGVDPSTLSTYAGGLT